MIDKRDKATLLEVEEMYKKLKREFPKTELSKLIMFAAIGAMARILLRAKVVSQSGRTVYVRWMDGSITKSTAVKGDKFDPKIGFGMCLLKHVYYGKMGKEYLKSILDNIQVDPKKRSKQK